MCGVAVPMKVHPEYTAGEHIFLGDMHMHGWITVRIGTTGFFRISVRRWRIVDTQKKERL